MGKFNEIVFARQDNKPSFTNIFPNQILSQRPATIVERKLIARKGSYWLICKWQFLSWRQKKKHKTAHYVFHTAANKHRTYKRTQFCTKNHFRSRHFLCVVPHTKFIACTSAYHVLRSLSNIRKRALTYTRTHTCVSGVCSLAGEPAAPARLRLRR